MIELHHLPAVNASLNAAATILLLSGYTAIRRGSVAFHSRCMIAAFITSILFLITYLTYHTLQAGIHTPFRGTGLIRSMYYVMLASHVTLAAIVPVLATVVLRRAWRGDFERHRRLARITFPIWLYVSVTGVAIYLMLYHWPRGPG